MILKPDFASSSPQKSSTKKEHIPHPISTKKSDVFSNNFVFFFFIFFYKNQSIYPNFNSIQHTNLLTKKQMKAVKITFWVSTIIIGGMMLFSGIGNALSNQESIDFISKLGYPVYLIPFLGVAKILGSIAILIPGYPRLKEWAYAGLSFDLIGATYSVAQGHTFVEWAPMLIFLVIIAVSYICFRKLEAAKA